jgi:hypothetical protein
VFELPANKNVERGAGVPTPPPIAA